MDVKRMIAAGVLGGENSFDYYVDSVNGNDGNSGLGPAAGSALKTIGALPTLVSGKRVGLACGSTFHEQFTIPANNISVGKYGSGTMPLLDCSDPMTNANFTKTGGQTNIYQYSATTNWGAGETSWINVWEAGAFLANTASLAACDAAAGSYYVASHTTATPIIYIHPNGNTNPISDGKLYEYSARSYGIGAKTRNNINVNGIRARRNFNDSGSFALGESAILTNCRASEGNKHNFYYGCGTTLTNCIGDEAYYSTLGSIIFVMNQDVGNGAGAVHNNCQAALTTADANVQGYGGHVNTSGTLGPLTYNSCIATNVAQAFSVQAGTTVVNINNAVMTGCARAFTISYGTDWTITGGSYTYTTLAKLLLNTVTSGVVNVTISGLTATYSSSHATGLIEVTRNGLVMSFTNCTFIDNNAVATGYFILSTNTITVYSHNNNFRSPNLATAGIYVYRLVGTTTMDSDYNTYSKNNFNYSSGDGTTYSTLAAFVAAKSQDVNSVVA